MPTDWSKVKCRNCNEFGHGAGRCPQPKVEDAAGNWGNGGNAGASAGASAGAWANADGGDSAAPTSNWADDTTSAANDNNLGDGGGEMW